MANPTNGSATTETKVAKKVATTLSSITAFTETVNVVDADGVKVLDENGNVLTREVESSWTFRFKDVVPRCAKDGDKTIVTEGNIIRFPANVAKGILHGLETRLPSPLTTKAANLAFANAKVVINCEHYSKGDVYTDTKGVSRVHENEGYAYGIESIEPTALGERVLDKFFEKILESALNEI